MSCSMTSSNRICWKSTRSPASPPPVSSPKPPPTRVFLFLNWSIDSPNLHTVRTELRIDAKVVDEVFTTFGYRTIRFDPDEEHWHGAAPSTFMTHLALQEVDDEGIPAYWGEHVSDEEYGAGQA